MGKKNQKQKKVQSKPQTPKINKQKKSKNQEERVPLT